MQDTERPDDVLGRAGLRGPRLLIRFWEALFFRQL